MLRLCLKKSETEQNKNTTQIGHQLSNVQPVQSSHPNHISQPIQYIQSNQFDIQPPGAEQQQVNFQYFSNDTDII